MSESENQKTLEGLLAIAEYVIQSFDDDRASHHPQLNHAIGLLQDALEGYTQMLALEASHAG